MTKMTIMIKEKTMVSENSLMLATREVLTPLLWNRLSVCMMVTTPKAKAVKEIEAFATVFGTEKKMIFVVLDY